MNTIRALQSAVYTKFPRKVIFLSL